MGLRLHSKVTDEEVAAYMRQTDKSPLQANDDDLVWVYQYVCNNQGRWTTVGKCITRTQVMEGWRDSGGQRRSPSRTSSGLGPWR